MLSEFDTNSKIFLTKVDPRELSFNYNTQIELTSLHELVSLPRDQVHNKPVVSILSPQQDQTFCFESLADTNQLKQHKILLLQVHDLNYDNKVC